MPLNRLHAFGNGPAFPRPQRMLIPRPLLRVIAFAERAFTRYLVERAWRDFARRAVVGANCRLGPAAWCWNEGPPESITLGEGVVCRGGLRRESFGDGHIVLQDYAYIGDDVLLSSAARIEVGAFSLLAHGVQVFDNDSHPTDARLRQSHYRALLAGEPPPPAVAAAPVLIGERVWIGTNTFIGKGVRIGRDSIVAAGSVVTRHVPDGSLVGGNPARILREP